MDEMTSQRIPKENDSKVLKKMKIEISFKTGKLQRNLITST